MTDPTEKAESAVSDAAEHRSSQRHEFPYVQRVAPLIGGKVPPAEQFFPVRCKDLSGGGMAILLNGPPDFESLVISLGVAPALSHVTARVVRVEQRKENGRTQYLVGCQFIGRAQLQTAEGGRRKAKAAR